MSALSPLVVEEFCKLCDWAFQVWLTHRELFDENPNAAQLQASRGAEALARLSVITQEYALHQIAKLHDSAVVAGQITLGIDYIIKYGGWDSTTEANLSVLAQRLNQFASSLRSARNKALSHNDLATIAAGQTLGSFPPGEDVKYFENLQEFANLVHGKVIGGPFPFDDLAKNDVVALLSIIKP
jgi:hypothetical protein